MTLEDYRDAMYRFRHTFPLSLHIRVQHCQTKEDLFSGALEKFYDEKSLMKKGWHVCEVRRVVCTDEDETRPIYHRSLFVTVY